jgi:hypothetical protein
MVISSLTALASQDEFAEYSHAWNEYYQLTYKIKKLIDANPALISKE